MDRPQLEATFDQQSATYDQQWAKLAAFREGIHLLLGSVFAGLPQRARMLCVGSGTGAEIHSLATRFPGCTFHTGYLDSLPESGSFDCATSLLVSQFILDRTERSHFFRGIATRLRAGGILASSDLAADVTTEEYKSLLDVWLRTMAASDVPHERLLQMQEAYARDVAILAPPVVAAIIASGGFAAPVQFYQAGLIHAWYTQRH